MIERYRKVQDIARDTMAYIAEQIFPGMNLREVRSLCESRMRELGADRVYIERGNRKPLGDVGFFTFEPHIATPGSVYGFKREDIYYFENGLLKCL